MNKTKNLLTSLIILSALFTSCGRQSTPVPSSPTLNQLSIYEFEYTYKYVQGTSRIFEMTISKDFNNLPYIIMTTLANPSGNPETLTEITRLNDSTFIANYRWGDVVYGDAMLYVDQNGRRKLYIEHLNGIDYHAVEY